MFFDLLIYGKLSEINMEKLKTKTYDEKTGTQEHRLVLRIQRHRKVDTESVGIGEQLFDQPAPLFCDQTKLLAIFAGSTDLHHRKLDVATKARTRTKRYVYVE